MTKDIKPYNKEGQEHGYWEDYHHNGKLYSKGNYHNGKRIGYWEFYWANGNIWNRGNYENDIEIGYWEFYAYYGELQTQIFHS
jgi:antitoxin component YwqK of YwqJK toxin-antitoxin module